MGSFQQGKLGVTGTRSKVLHRQALPPRDWSAACHRWKSHRFLVVVSDEDGMRRAFPDRRLCRDCERLERGGGVNGR